MSFFQLIESADESGWSVAVPPSQFIDQQSIWQFSDGKRLEIVAAIRLEIGSGEQTDLVLTGFSIPIVSDSFREVAEKICPNEVQFFPTTGCNTNRLWVMNVLSSVDCIDYGKSEIQLCSKRGRAFRHRFGKPEMITRLSIASRAVEGHNIFRVQDWRTAIVVSKALMEAIQKAKLKGIAFMEV